MNRRNLASILWFFAGWSGVGLFFGLMGWPPVLDLVPGIVLAVLIRLGPASFLWSRTGTGRRIVPINQFAAELDRRAAPTPMPGADCRRA